MNRDRRVISFVAGGFLFLGMDVWLGHVGGKLLNPAMWIPLIFLPLIFVVALWAVFSRAQGSLRFFGFFCRAAVGVGIAGFVFHLLRIAHDTRDVLEWRTVLVLLRNPPFLAPLAISALGVLGVWAINPQKIQAQS